MYIWLAPPEVNLKDANYIVLLGCYFDLDLGKSTQYLVYPFVLPCFGNTWRDLILGFSSLYLSLSAIFPPCLKTREMYSKRLVSDPLFVVLPWLNAGFVPKNLICYGCLDIFLLYV